jgi:hypothetical protein
MPDEAEILAADLRSWTVNHDAYVRAAVDLLIEQGHWLWDKGFTDACVRTSGDTTYISWHDADAYLQSGPPCSGGEAAILRIAIDLASDRWEITRLDSRNRGRVIEAVRQATGMDR